MIRLAETMQEALRLIRVGNPTMATEAIQRELHHLAGLRGSRPDNVDETIETVDRSAAIMDNHERSRLPSVDGTFIDASYSSAEGSRRYKLFIPGGPIASPLPLVVMLHGCTQSPDDFAVGTGMNELAATRQCFIAYPEQASSANGMKCWNWFRSSDQHRDHGEPAIIAGITREVMRAFEVDANRVYIAGLSAGGAMAVVLGRTYPDLYAAVGVHSGIPYAAAHDAPSAFAAMKGATSHPGKSASKIPQLIPTIVLHGDCDKTVHPSNGERLADQFCTGEGSAEVGCATRDGQLASAHAQVLGGHTYTRTLMRNEIGKVVVEYWLVHGAGHAWFGGNPLGSHTDPKGPNASKEILRFFLEHELAHRWR